MEKRNLTETLKCILLVFMSPIALLILVLVALYSLLRFLFRVASLFVIVAITTPFAVMYNVSILVVEYYFQQNIAHFKKSDAPSQEPQAALQEPPPPLLEPPPPLLEPPPPLQEPRTSLNESRVFLEGSRASLEASWASLEDSRASLEELRASLEKSSAPSEKSRASLEASWASLEDSRTSLEELRASLEKSSAPSEKSRTFLEGSRASLEASWASLENSRASLEELRASLENPSAPSEKSSASLEALWTSLKDSRASLEALWTSLDDSRASLEELRASLEKPSAPSEKSRAFLEGSRASLEASWASLEDSRASLEELRTSLEELRASLEKSSASPENSSASNWKWSDPRVSVGTDVQILVSDFLKTVAAELLVAVSAGVITFYTSPILAFYISMTVGVAVVFHKWLNTDCVSKTALSCLCGGYGLNPVMVLFSFIGLFDIGGHPVAKCSFVAKQAFVFEEYVSEDCENPLHNRNLLGGHKKPKTRPNRPQARFAHHKPSPVGGRKEKTCQHEFSEMTGSDVKKGKHNPSIDSFKWNAFERGWFQLSAKIKFTNENLAGIYVLESFMVLKFRKHVIYEYPMERLELPEDYSKPNELYHFLVVLSLNDEFVTDKLRGRYEQSLTLLQIVEGVEKNDGFKIVYPKDNVFVVAGCTTNLDSK